MERIVSASVKQLDPQRTLQITLKNKPPQRHLGVLFKKSDADLQCVHMHLAFHCDFRKDLCTTPTEPSGYHIIDPNLSNRKLRLVWRTANLTMVANDSGLVPYGFSYPNDVIDPATGSIMLSKSQSGLTCATFVMAIFSASGVELIDMKSITPPSEDDEKWQQELLKQISHVAGVSREHLDLLRNEIGNTRFRPEVIAAASIHQPSPSQMDDLGQLTESIKAV